MRQLRFLPAFLMLLLSACSDRFSDSRPDCPEGGTGDVVITLDADIRNENINVKSASGEEIPVDDFWVEIFNSKSKRLYCEKYAEAKDDVINLNTGDYRLLAKHGDSLGVGFDKPFYMADVAFAVEARKDNSVSAVAKLANVKVKVIFGENLSNTEFYGDCFAIVRNSDRKVKSELKFRKDETRAGYIPAGELILEVYAKIGDSYKYYPVEAKSYSPNDFVTFEIDADVRSGDVTVALTIDDSVEVLEKTVVIPADSALPAAEPVMSMDGFDNEGAVYMSSGTAPKIDELDIDINAPAELSSLMLEINSDCLASGGVPPTVDLLNPGTALTALKKAGFVWYVTTSSTVAVVDFKSVAAYLAMNGVYDPSSPEAASVKVTAKDKKGREVAGTVRFILEQGAVARVNVADVNVWATRIVSPEAFFDNGMPKDATLEYSTDGVRWESAGAPVKISSDKAVYATIDGLEPGTGYCFRVVSAGQVISKGDYSIVTEQAAQLGNSGMESWTTQLHHYKTKGLISDKNETRDWYRPWASEDEAWWDVNSKKTLATYTSQQYAEYKVVPTVSYSSDAAEGNCSAQLVSTFICNMASDVDDGIGGAGNLGGTITGMGVEYAKAAGEMFIGTSSEDGSHASEGHSFTSRPSSLSFKYKYDSYDNDVFKVTVRVEDASGNVIASKEMSDGRASSGWASMTIELDYSVLDRKAARIYVCFRSSSLADDDITYRKTKVTIAGTTKNGYIGSVLKVDDLQLNY